MEDKDSRKIDEIISKRYSCFHALMDQPRSKSELEDEMDCSRSTLDRALRDFEDTNLVRYEDGIWTPTVLGRYSYQSRQTYLSKLSKLREVAPILDDLPLDNQIDREFVVDSEVHKVDTTKPDTVIQIFLKHIEQGAEVRIVTSKLATEFINALNEYDIFERCDLVEVIIGAEVFKSISGLFPTLIEEVVSNSNIKIGQTHKSIMYDIWIIDCSHAGIILLTDQGKGDLLINSCDYTVNQVINQYTQIKQNSDF